ncbi:MAG: PDZ domain-containing protein [Deltaproteobacteria bacterium]|nr:PDZ domain-containing protein [Deltaproteobacteria bacterium]
MRKNLLLMLILSVSFSCSSHAWASSTSRNELMDLKFTIFYVSQRYLEPSRVDASAMFMSGLENAARTTPEIMVRKNNNTIEVEVMGKVKRFNGKITSVLYLMESFSDVYDFLKAHLPPDVKRSNVEYSMIIGMLETLDPHTNFMPPDIFKEMKIHHSGAFGGLGIVVAVCGGKLSVLKVLPSGPAFRTGLKPGDAIISIDGQITENLSLQEAVKRLRGEVGDPVSVVVKRDGKKVHTYNVTREIIAFDGVSSRSIDSSAGKLGYIKIKSFQMPTSKQVKNAIIDLKKQKIRGLILDLRDNGGGLLRSAIEIVNYFLDSGTIVAQVTKNTSRRGRREYRADFTSTIFKGPLVVLVDEGSASASEIVAGSLKYSGRALVIGSRTFGKGSVQDVIEYPADSALKITISQYLTFGDISIQGVGIVPDVELHEVNIDKKKRGRPVIYYTYGKESMKESSLKSSLKAARKDIGAKSTYKVWALTPPPKSMPFRCHYCGQDPDDDYSADRDAFIFDGAIKTARTALEVYRGKQIHRNIALVKIKPALEKFQLEQDRKIGAKLKKVMKIDWSDGKNKDVTPSLSVSLKSIRKSVNSSSWAKLQLTVKNTGKTPVHRLRAVIKSSNPRLNFQEVLFGMLAPGRESKKFIEVKIPRGVSQRTDYADAFFYTGHKKLSQKATAYLTINKAKNPVMNLSYHFKDLKNSDGKLEENETGEFHISIKNNGDGKCGESSLVLKNLTGSQVKMMNTRADLSDLAPGKTKNVVFRIKALKTSKDKNFQFKLVYKDCVYGQNVELPWNVDIISGESKSIAVKKYSASLLPAGTLVDVPSVKNGIPLFSVPSGSTLTVDGIVHNEGVKWSRIVTGDKKFPHVFVKTIYLKKPSAKTKVKFTRIFNFSPPVISLSDYSLKTDKNQAIIEGIMKDSDGLRDYYVTVSNIKKRIFGKKVDYHVLNGATQNRFKARVPLTEGINIISITARDNSKASSSENAVVLYHK